MCQSDVCWLFCLSEILICGLCVDKGVCKVRYRDLYFILVGETAPMMLTFHANAEDTLCWMLTKTRDFSSFNWGPVYYTFFADLLCREFLLTNFKCRCSPSHTRNIPLVALICSPRLRWWSLSIARSWPHMLVLMEYFAIGLLLGQTAYSKGSVTRIDVSISALHLVLMTQSFNPCTYLLPGVANKVLNSFVPWWVLHTIFVVLSLLG